MPGQFARLVQGAFHSVGLHVRRIDKGVAHDNALEEQLRLAGSDIRTIIEVGAADGRDCAIYAARCPAARVHAFEPLPSNFAKLQTRARIEPRIIPNQMAVSERAGRSTFHITALGDASSLLKPRETGSTFDTYTQHKSSIEVDVIDLGTYCREQGIDRVDLLKMDAQGNELPILKGAVDLLASGRIAVIYSEINFISIYDGCTIFRDLDGYLASMGYALHNIYNWTHNQRGQLAWADAIFVRTERNSQ